MRSAVLGSAARALAIAVVVAATLLVGARGVVAHTDVESVTPTDGSVMEVPIDEVVIVFARDVTATSNGFEAIDGAGRPLGIQVTTSDERRHVLRFDSAISDGEVAVRYEVRAEDGHTISGGFRFTVAAPSDPGADEVPSNGEVSDDPVSDDPVSDDPASSGTMPDELSGDATTGDVTAGDVTAGDVTTGDVTTDHSMTDVMGPGDAMDDHSMSGGSMPGAAVSDDLPTTAGDAPSTTDLPVAVYPTMGMAVIGGVALVVRLRARK
ncbi:MAG: copper resistance CopC family protein [Ilumatobacteraceae bacterium]